MPSTPTRARRASGNAAGSILIAGLAALDCARTPTPPVEPVPGYAALKSAKDKDRCVDALPSEPRRGSGDDDIVEVSLAGDRALGRTESRHIRVWSLRDGAVTVLPRDRFSALSADGSTGVTVAPLPPDGARLEAWDLAEDRLLAATDLENGLAGYRGPGTFVVTSHLVLVRVGGPPCDEECRSFERGPPLSELVTWDLASGKTGLNQVGQDCGAAAAVTPDGSRAACVSSDGDSVSWFGLSERLGYQVLAPAPEWRSPPPADPDERHFPAQLERYVPPSVHITSMQLVPGGSEVYLAYKGAGLLAAMEGRPEHHGWRLERWTPHGAAGAPGKVERLATSDLTLCTRLLATSADGRLLVFGGAGFRPTVRRAPRYDAEPFAPNTVVLAAAVSSDGASIVTGHPDGRLRLWDARTLGLTTTSK